MLNSPLTQMYTQNAQPAQPAQPLNMFTPFTDRIWDNQVQPTVPNPFAQNYQTPPVNSLQPAYNTQTPSAAPYAPDMGINPYNQTNTLQSQTLEQYLAQQNQTQLQTPADYGINPYDRPIATPSAPGVEQYLQQQVGATLQAPTATAPTAPATGVEAYLQGQQAGTTAAPTATTQSTAPSWIQRMQERMQQPRTPRPDELRDPLQPGELAQPSAGTTELPQQLTQEQQQYLDSVRRDPNRRYASEEYRRYDPASGIPFDQWKTGYEASVQQGLQQKQQQDAAKLAALQAQQGTFQEMTTGVSASQTPLAWYSDPSKVPAGQSLSKLSDTASFGGGWTGKTSNDALKNFVRSPEFLNNYNAYDLAKFGDLQKYIKDQAVVRSGGKVFMTEDQLNKAMSNLIPLPDQRLAQMAPLLGDLKNTGTYNGVKVYDKVQLARQMMNYYSPSPEQLAAHPELANLTPVSQLDGKNYYDVKQVNQILTPALINNLYQQYGIDPTAYTNTSAKGYISGDVSNNNAYVLSRIAGGKPISWDNFKQGFSDPKTILGNNDGKEELEKIFNPVFMTDYHQDLMEAYGGAYGLQPEEVEAVGRMVTSKLIADANGSAPFAIGTRADIGGTSGQYLNALWDYAEQKYGKPVNDQLKQQAQQAAVKLDTGLQKMRKYNKPDDNGGGILGKVFDTIDPILDNYTIHGQLGWRDKIQEATAVDLLGFDSPRSAFTVIMPMIVDGFFPGVGGLLNAAQSASLGDTTGIATGLISSYLGFSGGTGGVPLTDSSYVNSAITNAALTAGSAAAQGAEWDQALVSGLLSGIGAYGADYIKAISALNDWGAFGKGAAQAALKGGLSAAGAANQGGNTSQIINAGLGGAAGSAVGSVIGGLTQAATSPTPSTAPGATGQTPSGGLSPSVVGGLNQAAQIGMPLANRAWANYQRKR